MNYDILKNNRKIFLLDLEEKLQIKLKNDLDIISAEWDTNKNIILNSLYCLLVKIKERYNNQYESGSVGDLQYINISWLRVGLRTNSELYRIDFYDNRWRTCLIECADYWMPSYFFDKFFILKQQMYECFQRRNIAPKCYFDEIIYKNVEEVNKLFFLLIPDIINPLIKLFHNELIGVKIYAGDFMDYCNLIS